jgi:DNA-binding transcriptional LysR family regulator
MEFLVPRLFARLDGTAITLRLDDADVAEADFASLVADNDLVIGHTIGAEPAGADGLPHHVIATEPLDVALPLGHRLAGRAAVRAAELAGERWIGVPIGYPFDTVRIAIENHAGEPLEVVQRLRDNRLVEALVAAGQGCALLPRFTTRPRPDVVLVPLSDVRSVRRIVALGRPDRLERAAVRFVVDALAAIGAELE